MKVGSVTIAGVDDMPVMVVGRNVVDSGHHAAQEMVAADDEPQLLARIQRQPDWEQVDVHADDLSAGKLLDAVEAVDRHGVRRARLIEMPSDGSERSQKDTAKRKRNKFEHSTGC